MSDRINTLIEKHLEGKKVYSVPMRVKEKTKKLNPKTNRMKTSRKTRYLETTIPPEDRELDNIPRYSNGKPKVSISDWLELKKEPELSSKMTNVAWGWASNGKAYGWSHRAIHGFRKGDKVRRDTIGNESGKEFTIETDKQAEEMAKKFAKEVA